MNLRSWRNYSVFAANESQRMAIRSLDRVFQIVFARHRRQLGDERIDLAWRRACSDVWWFLFWPTAASIGVLAVVAYAAIKVGTKSQHNNFVTIFGLIAFFLLRIFLARYFKKFLMAPSNLQKTEPREAKRYLFWFRTTLTAGAWIVLIVGYLLHEMGVHFMRGF